MMKHLWTGFVSLFPFMLLPLSCGSEDRAPGIEDCNDVLCGKPGGTSTTPVPEAGTDAAKDVGQENEVSSVELSGTVVRFVEETFSETIPFEGWGSLRVPTSSGDEQIEFGDEASEVFSVSGVIPGPGWFTVIPSVSFLDGLLPTYSYLPVPEDGASDFRIPLMDRDVLTLVYASLESPALVRTDAAHVVVVFERAHGQRISGVTLISHPTAEAVAFDQGVGFASDATETGLNGTILLVNVVGTGPLIWESDGETSSLTLVHVPGQASFVRVVQ